jgi:hypothetical protein
MSSGGSAESGIRRPDFIHQDQNGPSKKWHCPDFIHQAQNGPVQKMALNQGFAWSAFEIKTRVTPTGLEARKDGGNACSS